jgi:hypothetical protein
MDGSFDLKFKLPFKIISVESRFLVCKAYSIALVSPMKSLS